LLIIESFKRLSSEARPGGAMNFLRTFAPLSFLALLATSAYGATFIVPEDHALLRDADAVVIGRIFYALPSVDSEGQIVTHVNLLVDRVFKGPVQPGASVQILVEGGILGDQARVVTSEPIYWPDGYVLAFLQQGEGGFYVTHAQALGKFELVNFEGTGLWVRGAPREEIYGFDYRGNPHVEIPRLAELFETYLNDVMDGKSPAPDYFLRGNRTSPVSADDQEKENQANGVIDPYAHFPASAYLMGGGTKFRWNRFDQGGSVAYRVSGSQPGYDSLGVAQRALAAWTNEPNSNVNLQYAGTSTAGFVQDGQNTIVFNSTSGVPSGAIGYSQISSSGTHTFKGETFYTVVEGDVVLKSGLSVSATLFEEAVTHEVGHSIAFRHSNEGTPADSNAIMNSVSTGRFGSNLQAWDREAASHVYGSGTATPPPPPCSPPVITSQPANRTITSGQSTTLTVGATGTAPLYYQWYLGTSGNTSTPVPGGGGASLTVAPTVGTNYWVRVSNACGSVNSATVTVNVAASPIALREKPSVFRAGLWIVDANGNGLWDPAGGDAAFYLGQAGDTPIVGDWDGNGSRSAAVFRPSQGLWVLDYNGNGVWDPQNGDRGFVLGQSGDVPIVGDWDGNGTDAAGIFRPSQGLWVLDYNGNGRWDGPTIDRAILLGQNGDTPVVGDWNGDGRTKVAVFRSGLWVLDYNGDGLWNGPGIDRAFSLGQSGDIALIGDWNGDGREKAGVFRPSQGLWVQDYNGDGLWNGPGIDRGFTLGQNGDIPIVGDWNGDGREKAGVFRSPQGLWVLDVNGNGSWDPAGGDRAFNLGQSGDRPLALR
jgi:hypothetical protein